jgi:hypothetical protein
LAATSSPPSVVDRVIALGEGLPAIPERLLLAHARGEVLFVTGAGISQPAGLPDFRGLVLETYLELDTPAHAVMATIPRGVCNQWSPNTSSLTHEQTAEISRFINGDYDVVLEMLERRMDGKSARPSQVRHTIAKILRRNAVKPAPVHYALMRLADRGGVHTIVTTNFDRLLEDAYRGKEPLQTYVLGGIPRPGASEEFSGIMHIHGALERDLARTSDLIISDRDFGEFYLRRRAVPDFIYDAARLFHLVLVGYSANDAPMRYLLNAVAADGSRFSDLKERFTFVGMGSKDPVAIEDWKGRGITPIPYDSKDSHLSLRHALERWAALSAINGDRKTVDKEIQRIVRTPRSAAKDTDRDLYDHLFRRGSVNERIRMSALSNKSKAGLDWLDAVANVLTEPDRVPR